MKKAALSITFIFLGLFFAFSGTSRAEIIRDFSTEINVLPDSTLLVKERISYDFENSIRRGIYRYIPLKNTKGDRIKIKVISVKDLDDVEYSFTTETKNNVLNIKIGDTGKIVSGVKVYNINYQVFGGILYHNTFDEVYWNVTGNNWRIPIQNVKATVNLPLNVFPLHQSCYYGELGSVSNCIKTDSNTFTTDRSLSSREGLTVAVGFAKGVVSHYEGQKENMIFNIVLTFWPVVIPVALFCFLFVRWFKKGRDPRGTGVIVPQYDAPNGISPIEAGGIIHENIKSRSISAEIIHLATKGYLKIKRTEEKILGMKYKQDYEITLLKEPGYLENNFDKEIIKAIFGEQGRVGGISTLSGLNNCFYKHIPRIKGFVIDNLLNKKYYTNLSKNVVFESGSMIMAVVLVFVFLGYLIWSKVDFVDSGKMIISVLSFVSSVGFILVFNFLMPAKSKKGVVMMEHLLGLKEYLQIAEKDRLIFHNAPEKSPEVFETLLPYAIIFGVEELWAKEFSDIYLKEPDWYESSGQNFNAVNFGRDLAVFNIVAMSSLSSSPNSSGSTGHGFSGGGSGGGGGGSW